MEWQKSPERGREMTFLKHHGSNRPPTQQKRNYPREKINWGKKSAVFLHERSEKKR